MTKLIIIGITVTTATISKAFCPGNIIARVGVDSGTARLLLPWGTMSQLVVRSKCWKNEHRPSQITRQGHFVHLLTSSSIFFLWCIGVRISCKYLHCGDTVATRLTNPLNPLKRKS